jgi:hypothetical protein
LILVVPTLALALDAADLPSAIENAKTAADHEGIAVYYDGEARAAHAMADRHRDMARSYAKHPRPSGAKGPRPPIAQRMRRHCERRVESYEAAAQEFEATAASIRLEAKAIE